VEGLPATAQVTVCVDAPDEQTRSIIDEDGANYVEDLWIGAYDAKTGARLGYAHVEDLTATTEVIDEVYQITASINLTSTNGAYIVAVANADNLYGSDDINDLDEEEALLTKLNEADTYEKFRKVYAERKTPSDVNVYQNSLTMSGWFAKDRPDVTAIESESIQPVTIDPGDNDLTDDGVIYLKRLISYNKFVITPGQYINLDLTTWQVCNIPTGCTVFETSGNAADGYTGDETIFVNSLASRSFTATTYEDQDSHYFEFYQFENKHQAVDYAALQDTDYVGIKYGYTDREREFKTSDSTQNLGLYKSLVASTDGDLSNNNASYVVLKARIDYYIAAPANMADFDPESAQPIDPDSDVPKIHRTADVVYTIHLGYCEQKKDNQPTLATAKDFNCRRNTKYLYHVTINGVRNIVVDARADHEPEDEPGAEGFVSDETGAYEELDSHYCEFNISFTDAERLAMAYRITSPYGNTKYVYRCDKKFNSETGKYDTTITKTPADMNTELYSWIKFYPTENKSTLAKFNGGLGSNTIGPGTEEAPLWTIDDLLSDKESPYDADADGNKWFTVFVDEYVYHFEDVGDEETSWPNYVNKDNRTVEFINNIHVSTDTESSYSYCKYAYGQKSIQSFYGNGATTGVGVEHIEETYCMNMNWQFYSEWKTERTKEHYDYANGRYNVDHYLDSFRKTRQWADIVQETIPAHVSAGSNDGSSHVAADYPVFMPGNKCDRPSNPPTPSDDAFYAETICMNRNRDLNGDGYIDVKEIRWFVPTSSVYQQIAIAQGELPDPFIRFSEHDRREFANLNGSHDRVGTYNYHYATSDYQYYWAEQYVTTGDNLFSGHNPPVSVANTVRCVRNLGTNPAVKPVLNQHEVKYAFDHDPINRTFTQTYFSDETLRGYTSGGLAPHDVTSPASRMAKKFQYAKHLVINAQDAYVKFQGGKIGYVKSNSNDSERIGLWTQSLRINGICSKYTEEDDESDYGTWRVPSAGEMALMWIEQIPQRTPQLEAGYQTIGDDDSDFFSCTQDYFVTWYLRSYDTNNQYYISYNDKDDRKVMALDVLRDRGDRVRLRCVRDVE
jgi:hypothetical protein